VDLGTIKTPDPLAYDLAKLRAYENTVELETFTIAPIRLTDIAVRPID
jgi:hypothetical protein